MMDWTDRHCRYFLRLLSPHSMLYTEMVTAAALIHGDAPALLQFNVEEHPVALQLGGCDPQMMADAARLGEAEGYDEININVGCPSDRVQSGQFGACLMARPELVASCVSSMTAAVKVPVTVKARIGIDDLDSYEFLCRFVETIFTAGCSTFVVHARKAILAGLSPKENRSVPPLNYERVYRLRKDYPELRIVLNGGITTSTQVEHHLQHVDGIMIGRQAYQDPWFLTGLEHTLHGTPTKDRDTVMEKISEYVERQLHQGVALKHMTRHLLGLYNGQPGARQWRRSLSENAHRPGAGIEVLRNAMRSLPKAA
jgi:tRNA-dihydrouridine synthase A